ncbi:hypothetical protein [Bacillus toyonensis]|uniref:hypothetical protein n=1 Tax=Bacillus toyonensis TaxID=155322 RepID=UPI0018A1A609|nr:hypothetical protein [Bacillus toyonensis]MBF7145194.1 hypothetical protein [Bacillus toyonensis]MEC2348773.1 hypothetical protein [Bacillus toyonensis]MED3185046.1 hypothetical protein [Bacillus toyonensis]
MTEHEKKVVEQIYEMLKEMDKDLKEFRSEFTDFRTEMKGFYSGFLDRQKEIVRGITTWQQKEKLN